MKTIFFYFFDLSFLLFLIYFKNSYSYKVPWYLKIEKVYPTNREGKCHPFILNNVKENKSNIGGGDGHSSSFERKCRFPFSPLKKNVFEEIKRRVRYNEQRERLRNKHYKKRDIHKSLIKDLQEQKIKDELKNFKSTYIENENNNISLLPYPEDKTSESYNCFVLCKGLPFQTEHNQIKKFFHPYKIIDKYIIYIKDKQGNFFGDAFVRFINKEQKRLALKNKNYKFLLHRYIQLFSVNEEHYREYFEIGYKNPPAYKNYVPIKNIVVPSIINEWHDDGGNEGEGGGGGKLTYETDIEEEKRLWYNFNDEDTKELKEINRNGILFKNIYTGMKLKGRITSTHDYGVFLDCNVYIKNQAGKKKFQKILALLHKNKLTINVGLPSDPISVQEKKELILQKGMQIIVYVDKILKREVPTKGTALYGEEKKKTEKEIKQVKDREKKKENEKEEEKEEETKKEKSLILFNLTLDSSITEEKIKWFQNMKLKREKAKEIIGKSNSDMFIKIVTKEKEDSNEEIRWAHNVIMKEKPQLIYNNLLQKEYPTANLMGDSTKNAEETNDKKRILKTNREIKIFMRKQNEELKEDKMVSEKSPHYIDNKKNDKSELDSRQRLQKKKVRKREKEKKTLHKRNTYMPIEDGEDEKCFDGLFSEELLKTDAKNLHGEKWELKENGKYTGIDASISEEKTISDKIKNEDIHDNRKDNDEIDNIISNIYEEREGDQTLFGSDIAHKRKKTKRTGKTVIKRENCTNVSVPNESSINANSYGVSTIGISNAMDSKENWKSDIRKQESAYFSKIFQTHEEVDTPNSEISRRDIRKHSNHETAKQEKKENGTQNFFPFKEDSNISDFTNLFSFSIDDLKENIYKKGYLLPVDITKENLRNRLIQITICEKKKVEFENAPVMRYYLMDFYLSTNKMKELILINRNFINKRNINRSFLNTLKIRELKYLLHTAMENLRLWKPNDETMKHLLNSNKDLLLKQGLNNVNSISKRNLHIMWNDFKDFLIEYVYRFNARYDSFANFSRRDDESGGAEKEANEEDEEVAESEEELSEEDNEEDYEEDEHEEDEEDEEEENKESCYKDKYMLRMKQLNDSFFLNKYQETLREKVVASGGIISKGEEKLEIGDTQYGVNTEVGDILNEINNSDSTETEKIDIKEVMKLLNDNTFQKKAKKAFKESDETTHQNYVSRIIHIILKNKDKLSPKDCLLNEEMLRKLPYEQLLVLLDQLPVEVIEELL